MNENFVRELPIIEYHMLMTFCVSVQSLCLLKYDSTARDREPTKEDVEYVKCKGTRDSSRCTQTKRPTESIVDHVYINTVRVSILYFYIERCT